MKRVLPRGTVMDRMNPHLAVGIPDCPQCEKPAVRWRNRWVCRFCFEVAAGTKKLEIGEALPNRAARRRR